MDRVKSGYSATTADPSTTLLRSSGRDDKGRAVTFWKSNDLDGRSSSGRRAVAAPISVHPSRDSFLK